MQEMAEGSLKSSTESSAEDCLGRETDSRLALRAASRGDESFLFNLFCSIRGPDFSSLEELERKKLLELQFAAQQRHYQMNMPESEHLIVLQDGGPIGRIILHRRNDELHLAEISILPEHRNRGIGSILIKKLIKAEGERGHTIRLHVFKQSAAVRLYERLGFSITGYDGAYLLMEKFPKSKEVLVAPKCLK
jgi:GNAT superfamily N-acetyltransferase